MEIVTEKLTGAYAIKVSLIESGKCVARAHIFVFSNSLHEEPFGFLEDVYVEEGHRGGGLGTRLVQRAIEEAKKAGCYKLIGTSRDSRPEVHRFYEKLGFKKWGAEFRMDFKNS